MQKWWQKKFSVFLGVGGALILILESTIGSVFWPVYDMFRDPLAMLTAKDAPYRGAFVSLQVVATVMILLSLWAIYQQYKSRRQDVLANRLQEVAITFGACMGLSLVSVDTMAYIAFENGLTVSAIIDVVYISVTIFTLYRYSQAAFKDEQISLGNAVLLLAILFGLFHSLMFTMGIIGWPLRGFFDVLAMDTLAAGFGFICWYHARKTAI